MILGIGIDIIQIKRIYNIYKKFPIMFPNRILGENEQSVYKNLSGKLKPYYLAKRFAAKEAVAKAMKSGIGQNITFKEIEIINDESGAPKVLISHKKNYRIEISIADEKNFAIAQAIIFQ